jgi:hypothetical protein
MRKLSALLTIFFITQTFIPYASASSLEKQAPLTLATLVENIGQYEKKEVSLVATLLGACMSGCKVWVADGDYKKGDPVALVWAKDDAFKFKTDATGQKVKLQGFAVGEYVDLCAIEKKEEKNSKKDPDSPGKDKKACDPPVAIQAHTEKEGTKQLKSITFFATSVEYLKE